MPQLAAWHRKYGKQGLVIIGNHAPEFRYEKKLENVQKATRELGIQYAVCLDNDFKNWKAYRNRYWPTKYLVDKKGILRYFTIGEGNYSSTEIMIERLLAETPQS